MSTLPFPFPQSDFIPWQPQADGETFTVPAPANSLTQYPTLRVQNTTRGTIYISNNIGSTPSEGVYDYRIGPYSSETITPNAQGVVCVWRGVAGSSENVGFTWSAVAAAPGGSSVGEPYFPTSQNVSWQPDDAGVNYVYVGQFLSPIGNLATWEIAPPLGNQGQTIVAMQIENRTGYTLTVFKDDVFGELLGVIEPHRATTLQIGTNQIYVTRDFGSHWSGGNESVTFYAYNAIPKLDPAAMYELPGIHEPAGTGKQFVYSTVVGGFGATLFTIPAGSTYVINNARLECIQASNAGSVTEWGELRASQGIDGQGGGARSFMSAGSFSGSGLTSGQQMVSRDYMRGPLEIVSRPAPFAPNAIQLIKFGGSTIPCIFQVSIQGWYLPG